MSNWRAIHCQTQREGLARDNLEAIGVPCFYPFRRVRHWRQHRTVWIERAYFPGYLFADLERHRPLGAIIGVERILGEGDLPESIIAGLRSLTETDGLVREPPLKKGDPVALGNLIATFDNLDETTATVLIPIFGHLWPTTLPVARLLS